MLREVLKKNGFDTNDFTFYGEAIAKIENLKENNQLGKLILVTSTSPTKYGEGKTTLAIGLNDAFNALGEKCVVALREPSLGPVFGMKGGATGGGQASVVPEMNINLHFTGDIHAITTANNLLSSIIDNHIFQGNSLGINPERIVHERCLDLNDRSLREVSINGHKTHFNISTASEFMALLCLAKDKKDLKNRIGNILVAYTYQNTPVFAKNLECVNALFLLLKDAIKPNVVLTKEKNLALIHGGPFANIAHGTNSVVSTKYALAHFDYTIVEAGFGSDMGALKYFDIVSRYHPTLKPHVVVINTTVQSLKYNGEGSLKNGICNLQYHIETMCKYTNNLLVVLNKHKEDTEEEIEYIKEFVEEKGLVFSISTGYLEGSKGVLEVAKAVLQLSENSQKRAYYSYALEEDLQTKIEKFCKENYGAKEVLFLPEAIEPLRTYSHLEVPICIAKTQYSITDNAKTIGYPKEFTMTVKKIKYFAGAGFITVYFGNILTMPGLSKDANYLKMEKEQ